MKRESTMENLMFEEVVPGGYIDPAESVVRTVAIKVLVDHGVLINADVPGDPSYLKPEWEPMFKKCTRPVLRCRFTASGRMKNRVRLALWREWQEQGRISVLQPSTAQIDSFLKVKHDRTRAASDRVVDEAVAGDPMMAQFANAMRTSVFETLVFERRPDVEAARVVYQSGATLRGPASVAVYDCHGLCALAPMESGTEAAILAAGAGAYLDLPSGDHTQVPQPVQPGHQPERELVEAGVSTARRAEAHSSPRDGDVVSAALGADDELAVDHMRRDGDRAGRVLDQPCELAGERADVAGSVKAGDRLVRVRDLAREESAATGRRSSTTTSPTAGRARPALDPWTIWELFVLIVLAVAILALQGGLQARL